MHKPNSLSLLSELSAFFFLEARTAARAFFLFLPLRALPSSHNHQPPSKKTPQASAWMSWEWAVYSTRAEDEPLLAAMADDAATAAAPALAPELLARGLAFPGVAAAGASPTRADYTAAQALLLCHYSLHEGVSFFLRFRARAPSPPPPHAAPPTPPSAGKAPPPLLVSLSSC